MPAIRFWCSISASNSTSTATYSSGTSGNEKDLYLEWAPNQENICDGNDRDRVTRQHYYYQLRENVLRHGQPATEESFFRLAALALQAELGDYDPERHRAAYFDTQLYFPQWVRKTKTNFLYFVQKKREEKK